MPPPDDRTQLHIDHDSVAGRLTMTMAGVLDGSTYRAVRDAVVKAAIDEPRILVVEVTALHVPTPSAWSVFTSVRWLLRDWPEVPLALVCAHSAGRRELRRSGVARYVPVYGTVSVATDVLTARPTPLRRRVRQCWPAGPEAVVAAQRFVGHWLSEWAQHELIATASVVATVLVDNVLRHTDSDPDLRLETDGDTVTVAVTDGSQAIAGVHEHVATRGMLHELQIVSALSRVWGNSPMADGKVVWVVMGPENRL
jgi:hypothetical protein